VSKALNDGIRRLSVLVDEFNLPFHPHTLVLNVYKKELHSHLESGLFSNLRAKLSTALVMNMDQNQREIIDKMSTLLPDNKRNINVTNRKCGPFEFSYLNSDKLFGDFHEQLEFNFSRGLSKLITELSSLANWLRTESRNESWVLIVNTFFFFKIFNCHYKFNIIISSSHLTIHQPAPLMVHLVALKIVKL